MAGLGSTRVVAVDASVLINLIHVNRLDPKFSSPPLVDRGNQPAGVSPRNSRRKVGLAGRPQGTSQRSRGSSDGRMSAAAETATWLVGPSAR